LDDFTYPLLTLKPFVLVANGCTYPDQLDIVARGKKLHELIKLCDVLLGITILKVLQCLPDFLNCVIRISTSQ